ncbi:MAG: hypothetical protein GPJ51_08530 [Candidatus Heimdallarchaeota archaeon]|nr:hypothetical protein [Candidatus Heimdallarchaeota archaeon]
MQATEYSKDIFISNNSDTCVFLFHGLSATPYELKDWAARIAELKVDVKVPLLPLHGVNSELLCSAETADVFYDWGFDYINDLKKNYKKVIGLGISLGGGTIFDYLVNKVEDLDGAIMLGTGGFVAWDLGILTWLVRIFNVKAIKNPLINEFDRKLLGDEYFDWKMRLFPKVPVKMLMKALHKQKKEGLEQKMRDIKCPILIINGTTGLLTERTSISQYFEFISSTKKYGLLVEGATHTVHKSKFNQQILEHILGFISEVIDSENDDKVEEIIVLE